MSISAVSGGSYQYQAPVTPKAQLDDERTESAATKLKEAATGKDSPVPVQSSHSGSVDITA